MTTDYIAGPMRGVPKFNFPMFDEVAAAWRRKGNQAINPADHDREVAKTNGVQPPEEADGYEAGELVAYHVAMKTTFEALLGWDLVAIIQQCDGIIMLPGWETSTGAGHEKYVAEATGKTVRYAHRTCQGHWLFFDYDYPAHLREHTYQPPKLEVVKSDLEREWSVEPLHHRDPAPVYAAMREDALSRGAASVVEHQHHGFGPANLKVPDLLGLMGFAQVGKDTLAAQLVEYHGYTRVSFADTLRECLYALNPSVTLSIYFAQDTQVDNIVTVQELVDRFGWDKAKQDPAIRELLQRLGTEVGRNILGVDIWVDTAMRKVDKLLADGGKVVITDVRFPNEFVAVQKMGGFCVRIYREGYGPVNGHWSETALEAYTADVNIRNDGVPADMVLHLLKELP